MKPDVIIAHCSFIGHTGYANHTREFFTHLNRHIPVRVRNYTHVDDVSYLTQDQKDMVINNNNELPWDIGKPFDISNYKNPLNIVLNTTDHQYFYDKYTGPVIFYNVWESTRQPDKFFNKMLEADQFWCPSEWQRLCTVEQGYPIGKAKVVPEGIDADIFKPRKYYQWYGDGYFRFLLFGRWEYRKSTTEIIRTFLSTFKEDDKVRLVLSVDNDYAVDGMSNTEERLKHYGWDKDPRLEVVHFIPFDEYLDYLQTGNCLVSCSRSEGWNLPLMEAIACGTPTIHSDFSGQLEFAKGVSWRVNIKGYKPPEQMYGGNAPGLWAEPDFKHLSSVMKFIYKNHNVCRTKAVLDSIDIRKKYSWDNAAKIALKHIEELKIPESAHIALKENDVHSDMNKDISPNDDDLGENRRDTPKDEIIPNAEDNVINYHFVDGPFLEVLGNGNEPYTFIFCDEEGNEDHKTSLTPNHWTRSNRRWFTNWHLSINYKDKTIFEHQYDAKGKKVMISFDSKSLGDTLAWIPYCEKFRLKHRCRVVVSTFWNDLFKDVYKGLEFVPPGTVTSGIYASYTVGCWDRDLNKNKFDWRETPLQKVCTDILGLEYEEVKPRIKKPDNEMTTHKPLVTISEGSTAGCKQYQYPDGWQSIVDYLKEKGYDIAVISKESTTLTGVIDLTNKPIEETMSAIMASDFYMGVSSGPSWLAWALDVPVVLISGCTNTWNEFQSNIMRIINEDVCHGCMNNKNVVFDRGIWHWCLHKDNPRHYECTKSISPQTIIDRLEKDQWVI